MSITRARTHAGETLSTYLADGKLCMQCCSDCGKVQYPPTEICRKCLSDQLSWQSVDPSGKVLACVAVYRSYAADFESDTPWFVASVKMTEGPVVFAHAFGTIESGSSVRLRPIRDRLGDGVLGVVENEGDTEALQDRFE